MFYWPIDMRHMCCYLLHVDDSELRRIVGQNVVGRHLQTVGRCTFRNQQIANVQRLHAGHIHFGYADGQQRPQRFEAVHHAVVQMWIAAMADVNEIGCDSVILCERADFMRKYSHFRCTHELVWVRLPDVWIGWSTVWQLAYSNRGKCSSLSSFWLVGFSVFYVN